MRAAPHESGTRALSAQVENSGPEARHFGLLGATGIGVGAIVGGSFLALAGTGFEKAGPAGILAFALNGGIALLTALSFSELAVRFPRSGGTYTYARKVLSLEAAFGVGWIVWFASVLAAVFYAMGFSVFFLALVQEALGSELPAWAGGRLAHLACAFLAVLFYKQGLVRRKSGGSQWANVLKVLVFGGLIVAGAIHLAGGSAASVDISQRFSPFFHNSWSGLLQAMGFTFVALQGFDLIPAVGGEVKNPARNLPRAMLLALFCALAIYLPLLFLVVALGTPGEPVMDAAARDPVLLVAVAVGNFMGSPGRLLVIVGGTLGMLSAVQANLLAASRFARTMGSDRTLPSPIARLAPGSGTPKLAVRITAGVVLLVLLAMPDVASAGAAASLIFLASFALVHLIALLARRRAGAPKGFKTPFFPLVPVAGGVCCLGIGLFLAINEPQAGVLVSIWLSGGALFFALYLAPRARVVDAQFEGHDTEVLRLRGRKPVVLAAVANPTQVRTMVAMADALAPQEVARLRVLNVIEPLGREDPGSVELLSRRVADASSVLSNTLGLAMDSRLRLECSVTVHADPWGEIERYARTARADTLLVGMGERGSLLSQDGKEGGSKLAGLVRRVARFGTDVVILMAPGDWSPSSAERILVPSAGRIHHGPLRARLLSKLERASPRDVRFIRILPPDADQAQARQAGKALQRLAMDEAIGRSRCEVAWSDRPADIIVERSKDVDLAILGIGRPRKDEPVFSETVAEVANRAECPLILLSRGVGSLFWPASRG